MPGQSLPRPREGEEDSAPGGGGGRRALARQGKGDKVKERGQKRELQISPKRGREKGCGRVNGIYYAGIT